MAGGIVEYVFKVKDEGSAALEGTADAARSADEATSGMSDRAEELQESAGEADSVLQGFAGALEQVSPAAANAVRVLGDMAGGLEAVARGSGSALAIAGPLVIALGALVAAYVVLRGSLDDATAAFNRERDAQKQILEISRQVQREKIVHAALTGKMSEAEAEAALIALEAGDAYRDQRERITENLRVLKEFEGLLQSLQKQGRLTTSAFGAGIFGAFPEAVKSAEQNTQLTEDFVLVLQDLQRLDNQGLTRALNRVQSALAVTQSRLGLVNKLTADKVQRDTEVAEVSADVAKNTRDTAKALAEQAKQEIETAKAAAERQTALEKILSVEQKARQSGLSEEQKLQEALQERLGLIQRILEAYKEDAEVRERAEAARQAALADYDRQLEAVRANQEGLTKAIAAGPTALDRASGAISFAGQALGGDALGLLGGLGPAGAVAGAGLGVLQGIGAAGGAAGLEEKLDQMTENITAGIRALPGILGEVLPEFIAEFIPQLIASLIESGPDVFAAITTGTVKAIGMLLRRLPGILLDALKQVFKGTFEKLGDAFRNSGQAIRGFLDDPGGYMAGNAGVQSFAKGTSLVDRTGIALVHRGEQIIPHGGRATQAAGGSGGPSGVTININGIVGPETLNELSRAIAQAQERGLVF
jgi:septal ring factor EnvC (AmiA/AmiB activator)